MNTKMLICDTSSEVRNRIKDILREFKFQIIEAKSASESIEIMKHNSFNLVIIDTELKDEDGAEVFRKLRKEGSSGVNIILMAENPTLETAIAGIKLGVLDYLVKPLQRDDVIESVKKLTTLDIPVKNELQERKTRLGLLIGSSPKMQSLYSTILQVAPTNSTVRIQGESGVGKELVARTIHELSPRRNANFIPLNCSAVPVNLLETELFGHVRGAFSGASRDHLGIF